MKVVIKVETEKTVELFDDIRKAYIYIQKHRLLKEQFSIDIVEVNPQNLYFEKDGELNYEDNSLLFGK